MINIHDKEKVFDAIDKFKVDAKPLFGKLTPQHVLEHLTVSLSSSVGKRKIEFSGNQELTEKIKATIIYSDAEIPQGIKNPLLSDELPPLRFENIEVAKQQLKNEVEYFYDYKQKNLSATSVHPRMNILNMDEWTIFHSKHFTHHFKQYGLL